MRIYLDFRDWWIGYYRSPTHHYVCTDPTVVIRWRRRLPASAPAVRCGSINRAGDIQCERTQGHSGLHMTNSPLRGWSQ